MADSAGTKRQTSASSLHVDDRLPKAPKMGLGTGGLLAASASLDDPPGLGHGTLCGLQPEAIPHMLCLPTRRTSPPAGPPSLPPQPEATLHEAQIPTGHPSPAAGAPPPGTQPKATPHVPHPPP